MNSKKLMKRTASIAAFLTLVLSKGYAKDPTDATNSPNMTGDVSTTNNAGNQSLIQQPNEPNTNHYNGYQTSPVNQNTTSDQAIAPEGGRPSKFNKAGCLLGMEIRNQDNQRLGKVADIVIDLGSERVSYAVIAPRAGFLGDNKKRLAVPLSALKPGADGDYLVLNADKSQMRAALGFTRDNYPDIGSPSWGAEPFLQQGGNGDVNYDWLYDDVPRSALHARPAYPPQISSYSSTSPPVSESSQFH